MLGLGRARKVTTLVDAHGGINRTHARYVTIHGLKVPESRIPFESSSSSVDRWMISHEIQQAHEKTEAVMLTKW